MTTSFWQRFPKSCVPTLRRLYQVCKQRGGEPAAEVVVDRERGSLVVMVVSRDWAGLLDSVTTYLHTLNVNLQYIIATLLRKKAPSISGIYVEAPLNPSELDTWEARRQELQETLEMIIQSGEKLRDLLLLGTQKLRLYQEIMNAARRLLDRATFHRFVESQEAAYFVHTRSEAYLRERSPEDLAQIVIHNWQFLEELREQGKGVRTWVHNLKTQREHLTGITVAGFEPDVTLDSVLEVLRGYDPTFIRKYDKEFVTPEGVAVVRLEITRSDETPFPENELPLLEREIQTHLSKGRRRSWEAAPGAELLGRILIPQLLEEARRTQIPQLFLLPQQTSPEGVRFVLLLVTPEEQIRRTVSPLLSALVDRLSHIPGVSVTGSRPPHTQSGIWTFLVDLVVAPSAFEREEDLYDQVNAAVQTLLGQVRDFDMGMRKRDRQQYHALLTMLEDREVSERLARRYYNAMNTFVRLSLPAEKILDEIVFADELLKTYFQNGERVERVLPREDRLLLGAAGTQGSLPLNGYIELISPYSAHMTSLALFGASLAVLAVEQALSEDDQHRLIEAFHTLNRRQDHAPTLSE